MRGAGVKGGLVAGRKFNMWGGGKNKNLFSFILIRNVEFTVFDTTGIVMLGWLL